ncbi:hypothetical protein PGQ11_009569 [Apiospora arundinis]|uniref:Uncharacterized protein n=1 Tax=Apiospora arundinis TaxID=335852 RepID=A0ABR2IJ81_9PEZI
MATNQPGLEPAASHAYPGIEVQSQSHAPQQYAYPGSINEDTQPSYPAQQHAYTGYQAEKGTTTYAPTGYAPTARSAVGDDVPPRRERRRILGLTVPVFWCLLIALILILAAGIGGGIGGGMAAGRQRNSESDSSKENKDGNTNTADNASAAAATSTGTGKPTGTISYTSSTVIPTKLPLYQPKMTPTDGGCPSINGSRYTPPDGAVAGESAARGIILQGQTSAQSFVRLCNTNFSGFRKANPGMVDLLEFFAETFDACMTACAEYNRQYQEHEQANTSPEGWCKAVSLSRIPGGKCYLKSKDANSPTNTTDSYKEQDGSTSALLVEGV